MVIFDDLNDFSELTTGTERLKTTSNKIFRSEDLNDYKITIGERPPRIEASDRVLNIQPNNVVMTNMVANLENFNKMLEFRELTEKPSDNTEKIDYLSQSFKDTLYHSLEIGRLDDRYSQTCDQIEGGYVSTSNYTEPIGSGIPLPVCLPCTQIVNDISNGKISNYNNYLGFDRLPIYAGLFCDEEQITEKYEPKKGAVVNNKFYTLLGEFRDNKMYELDFYSRYNPDRAPKSGNLTLPSRAIRSHSIIVLRMANTIY